MTHHAFIERVAFYGSRRRFLPEQYYNLQIMQMFVPKLANPTPEANEFRIPMRAKHRAEHTNPKAEAGATLFLKRPNLPAKAGKSPPPKRTNPPPEAYPVSEAAKSSSQGGQVPALEADKSSA